MVFQKLKKCRYLYRKKLRLRLDFKKLTKKFASKSLTQFCTSSSQGCIVTVNFTI